MKKVFLALAAATVLLSACNGPKNNLASVDRPASFDDEAYFESLNTLYEDMPLYSDNIVMVGDDFIAGGNWSEFYADTTVKNRGIKYDRTEHVLYRIDKIAQAKPAKIFVSVGYNDIRTGANVKKAEENVKAIFQRIAAISPETDRYFMNICFNAGESSKFNEDVKAFSSEEGFEYIDVAASIESGLASGEFGSLAGKLNGAGYAALAECLEPYIGKESTINAQNSVQAGDYRQNRADMFASLENTLGRIFMVGDDFIENGPWVDLFPFSPVVCRGIATDRISDVANRVEEFAQDVPNKVFLMVGAKDIEEDNEKTVEKLWTSYVSLLKKLQAELPNTTVYIMSVLPRGRAAEKSLIFNAKVKEINRLLSAAGDAFNYIYLDMASLLTDFEGFLMDDATSDGKTVNSNGYYRIAAELIKGSRFIAINIPR